MLARRRKWSALQQLFKANEGLEIKNKPGVYRIRAFTKQGKARCIPRAGGVDREGILHIGEAKNLEARMQMFMRAATKGKAAHHAGREFLEWHFERLIPRENLRVDFIETRTKEQAQRRERALHIEYRKEFLDRPPLDSTSGHKRG